MMRIHLGTTVLRAGATGHSVCQQKERAAKLATNFAVFPAGSCPRRRHGAQRNRLLRESASMNLRMPLPVNRYRPRSRRYGASLQGDRSQDMDLPSLKRALLLQRRANAVGQNVASRRVYKIRPDSP